MASIKDVAKRAGVSSATVSRVLANKPHVRPELQERVLTAVRELDYRPNLVARSLRVQQSNIVGLVVSDIQNPFFTAISRAVEDAAYAEGMNVFLCNTDEDPAKEVSYLNLMRDAHVAGAILSPTLQTAGSLADVLDPAWPLVVIDRRVQDADVDTVVLDNVDSAQRLVDHLIEHGHRRIAALTGITSATGRERHQGYLRSLRAHGLDAPAGLTRRVPPRQQDGYQAANELLAMDPPPDAIVATNSLLTLGALNAIRDRGLRIPDDVALVGFDDTTWAALVDPPITVVCQPTYELGQTAAELLFRRLENPDRPTREVVLKGKLIVRGSCGHHEKS